MLRASALRLNITIGGKKMKPNKTNTKENAGDLIVRPYRESDLVQLIGLYQSAFSEPPWDEYRKCIKCGINYGINEVKTAGDSCKQCNEALELVEFWSSEEIKGDLEFALSQPEPLVLVAQTNKDPYRVLIATVLSLRTKDQVTAKASRKLFAKADTPKAMLTLTQEDIQQLIYPVGFYRTKAKNILKISNILLDEHKGNVPNDMDTLLELPNVGRKTANLVLSEGFGIPAMCVDVHVHRISNRFGYIDTKNPFESEMALREKLPKKYWIEYNYLLVAFGQHTCAPISPWCSKCPVEKHCGKVGIEKSR